MSNLANKILIRKMRIGDTDDIMKIQAAITQTSVKTDFKRIIREQLQKEEEASFVAEIDGRVVGYMISHIVHGGFGLEKGAWIVTFGVDPEFMGRGIGKRLAEEIFNVYCKMGIKAIYTTVRWDSVDLLSFFKTLGFDRSRFINLRKELDS